MVTFVLLLVFFGMLVGLTYASYLVFIWARSFLVALLVAPWVLLLTFGGRWLKRRARRNPALLPLYQAFDLGVWYTLPFQVVFFSTLVVGLLVILFGEAPESMEDFVFGMIKISVAVVMVIAGIFLGIGLPISLNDRIGNPSLRRFLQLPLFLLGGTLLIGMAGGVPYLLDTRFATLADVERQGLTLAEVFFGTAGVWGFLSVLVMAWLRHMPRRPDPRRIRRVPGGGPPQANVG